MKNMGLYIHIPFCKKKCEYCDFISYEGKEKLVEKYIECVKHELTEIGEQNRIDYENNLDDSDISEGLYIEADYDLEQIQVTRVFSYLLTILIFAITLINIINIIISDIDTRKHYFSILISIGMTKKQLTRMILKEYIKYFIIRHYIKLVYYLHRIYTNILSWALLIQNSIA